MTKTIDKMPTRIKGKKKKVGSDTLINIPAIQDSPNLYSDDKNIIRSYNVNSGDYNNFLKPRDNNKIYV